MDEEKMNEELGEEETATDEETEATEESTAEVVKEKVAAVCGAAKEKAQVVVEKCKEKCAQAKEFIAAHDPYIEWTTNNKVDIYENKGSDKLLTTKSGEMTYGASLSKIVLAGALAAGAALLSVEVLAHIIAKRH